MVAIPLPKPADEPEEGWIMGSMKHANALTKQNIENKYLPITSQAEAASKLAYANLMGPQFLAKLMANDPILANMTEVQKKAALAKLYGAGTGQGTGASFMGGGAAGGGNPMAGNMMPSPRGDGALNALLSYFSGGSPNQQAQQPQQNAMMPQAQPMAPSAPSAPQNSLLDTQDQNLSPTDRSKINAMQPGDAVTIQGNQPQPQQPVAEPTFAENTGTFKGVVEEGKKAGEIRAQNMEELGNQYESALDRGYAYDELSKIATSPLFQQMRSEVPLFQEKQLKVLSKIGTPEEQKMIGDLITSSQELVRDTVNSFKGQKMKGELTIAQNMKISPDDTYNVMVGKLQAGMLYNDLGKKRTELAHNIMKSQHVDKQTALEAADKQLDGAEVRRKINDKLNPTVTIRNKKTGEVMTISAAEARKLGVPNV